MVDVLTMNAEIPIEVDKKRTAAQKVTLFRSLFRGLEHVYGTYDLRTGKAYQVKAPVTDMVIHHHLAGKQPYGVYPLKKDRTWVVVVDFDNDDTNPPLQFVAAASHYGLSAYVERSKSKGFHVWMFCLEEGVLATKARLDVRHILEEIGQPNAEIFPKQDALDERNQYGNFINAPLFGRLVPHGRTIFLDPENGLTHYPNQCDFLDSVERITENMLDEIIEINNLENETPSAQAATTTPQLTVDVPTFGLPPCARRMLSEGVTEYQRVACFRLAVDLKKAGVPLDVALAGLYAWALKAMPTDGKGIITRQEVMAQAAAAYGKGYRSCGCGDPAVVPFCNEQCRLRKTKEHLK